jgi:hypothetical protein
MRPTMKLFCEREEKTFFSSQPPFAVHTLERAERQARQVDRDYTYELERGHCSILLQYRYKTQLQQQAARQEKRSYTHCPWHTHNSTAAVAPVWGTKKRGQGKPIKPTNQPTTETRAALVCRCCCSFVCFTGRTQQQFYHRVFSLVFRLPFVLKNPRRYSIE